MVNTQLEETGCHGDAFAKVMERCKLNAIWLKLPVFLNCTRVMDRRLVFIVIFSLLKS